MNVPRWVAVAVLTAAMLLPLPLFGATKPPVQSLDEAAEYALNVLPAGPCPNGQMLAYLPLQVRDTGYGLVLSDTKFVLWTRGDSDAVPVWLGGFDGKSKLTFKEEITWRALVQRAPGDAPETFDACKLFYPDKGV